MDSMQRLSSSEQKIIGIIVDNIHKLIDAVADVRDNEKEYVIHWNNNNNKDQTTTKCLKILTVRKKRPKIHKIVNDEWFITSVLLSQSAMQYLRNELYILYASTLRFKSYHRFADKLPVIEKIAPKYETMSAANGDAVRVSVAYLFVGTIHGTAGIDGQKTQMLPLIADFAMEHQ